MWQYLAVASAVAGASASYTKGKTDALAYKTQALSVENQAKEAKIMGDYKATELLNSYSDQMGTNLAMAAISGTDVMSGSTQAVLRGNAEKLEWDIKYNALNTDMTISQLKTQASSLRAGAKSAKYGAKAQVGMQLLGGATQFASIGGFGKKTHKQIGGNSGGSKPQFSPAPAIATLG